jgi:hypothetical protein
MEKIASGQSFYCGSYWRGIAKFNNKMRLAGQNSNFFKMDNSQKRNEATVIKKSIGLG